MAQLRVLLWCILLITTSDDFVRDNVSFVLLLFWCTSPTKLSYKKMYQVGKAIQSSTESTVSWKSSPQLKWCHGQNCQAAWQVGIWMPWHWRLWYKRRVINCGRKIDVILIDILTKTLPKKKLEKHSVYLKLQLL